MRLACALVVVGGVLVVSAGPARAIVMAGNNTSITSPAPTVPASVPAGNVGTVLGASAVYLGNDYVLTAAHVGGYNTTFDGVTYAYAGNAQQIYNPDGSAADLIVYQISGNTGLPTLNLATASPSVGETYYNFGYGLTRDTALQNYNTSFAVTSGPAAYQGYGLGAGGLETAGTNTVLNVSMTAVPASTETFTVGNLSVVGFAGAFTSTTDQITSGDSGGGVFDAAGDLIGINEAVATSGAYSPPMGQTTGGQPTGTEVLLPSDGGNNADFSILTNVATYASQIDQITGIPEPTSVSLLLIGAGSMMGRRSRR